MAVWSATKNDIQRRIEVKVRALRGNVGLITGEDRFVIFEAINEAIIDMSIKRGIDAPMPTLSHTTITTTADTNYIDLDASYVKVLDGTVRIPDEDIILKRFESSVKDFYAFDPGEDISSSYPCWYCLDNNGSGAIRMRLRCIPDDTYTIYLDVEAMPDEESISTFPGWYHPCLRSLATAIALENLGLDYRADQLRYNDRIKDVQEKQRGHDGPIHINTRKTVVKRIPPELRANI